MRVSLVRCRFKTWVPRQHNSYLDGWDWILNRREQRITDKMQIART